MSETPLPEGYISIDDHIAEQEKDPVKKAALDAARVELLRHKLSEANRRLERDSLAISDLKQGVVNLETVCDRQTQEIKELNRRLEEREGAITAKFLEECGYVRKGGARLTYQGGDNIVPTAVEWYNHETGHSVLEFVSVPPVLLEKGKESQYVKRYLYWASLTEGEERWVS